MEKDIVKLDLRVSKLEEDAKEFHKIIEPIRERSIRLDEHYTAIMKTLNEVKDDVKELKDRPSKLFDYLIMCIISGIVAFLFKIFGN